MTTISFSCEPYMELIHITTPKNVIFFQLILNDGTQYFGICFIFLPDIKIYTYYLLTRFTPHEQRPQK